MVEASRIMVDKISHVEEELMGNARKQKPVNEISNHVFLERSDGSNKV